MANPAIDLTGKVFGYLMVLGRAGSTRTGQGSSAKATWLCKCTCGQEVIRESQSLRTLHRPNARHCGCRHGEHIVTHGMSYTRPYSIWRRARARCIDPLDKDWRNYGARGITMCAPWAKSFAAFWKDMREGYSDTLTLGRSNNSNGYSKRNCRWETVEQQCNNTRKNVVLKTPKGLLTVTQAARAYGLKKGTLEQRLRRGWPVALALTDVVTKARRTYTTSSTAGREAVSWSEIKKASR